MYEIALVHVKVLELVLPTSPRLYTAGPASFGAAACEDLKTDSQNDPHLEALSPHCI